MKTRHLDFKRDFNSNDLVNAKLNVCNNSLYSFCTAICLAYGCHPSIGFLHGTTRRGGLAFDLADLIKHETTLKIAFDRKVKSTKHAMYELSKALKRNNFELTKLLIQFGLYFSSGGVKQVGGFDVSRDTQQEQGQAISGCEEDHF